ncbi:TIGR03503 family protein [Ferrimonas balearica]|uniref:TIGR03503 family protein n=1 Tax=Ferrimonas balearica TaxID=44012 RepID=UPI001C9977BB|nr:TIGR03503 family protein [Ferrimonas balearica]MBY5992007.1 TIGR03503 family protein [Ferrimonas balearica]
MPSGFVTRTIGRALLGLLLLAPAAQALERAQTSELLDNRFRIDHAVDSITLLVQRRPGSAPVVVVRPDGSKWYAHRHPDSVRWNVANASDMIQIDAPTPGPWQLVGEVVDGSELKIMSGVALRHDPIPATVYRGERVKLTAEVTGDDERIVIRDFHEQLDWSVAISSANRPGDENFAAGPFVIGAYQDKGEGLDEVPHDGIFTSDLNFNYPAGLYRYKMTVDNPVFHREVTGQIEILPQPVRLGLMRSESDKVSALELSLEEEVSPEQVHLALMVETPDQNRYPITLTPHSRKQRVELPMLGPYGNYRIEGEAVGTRTDGKEFYLQLPQLSFYVAPPPPPPLSREELEAIALKEAKARESEARARVIWTVGGVNLVLVLVGGVALVFWRKRQRLYQQLMAMPIEPSELTPDQVDLNQFSEGETPGPKG